MSTGGYPAMTKGVAQRRYWTFYETVKVAVQRFQQQMLMVAHQAVGMNDYAISYRGRFQVRAELFPILPTFEDILLFVTPRGHMVERARIFDSKGRATGSSFDSAGICSQWQQRFSACQLRRSDPLVISLAKKSRKAEDGTAGLILIVHLLKWSGCRPNEKLTGSPFFGRSG